MKKFIDMVPVSTSQLTFKKWPVVEWKVLKRIFRIFKKLLKSSFAFQNIFVTLDLLCLLQPKQNIVTKWIQNQLWIQLCSIRWILNKFEKKSKIMLLIFLLWKIYFHKKDFILTCNELITSISKWIHKLNL